MLGQNTNDVLLDNDVFHVKKMNYSLPTLNSRHNVAQCLFKKKMNVITFIKNIFPIALVIISWNLKLPDALGDCSCGHEISEVGTRLRVAAWPMLFLKSPYYAS